MTPRPRVTTREVVQWAAEIAAGGTIRAIATRTGRSPRTIASHLPVPATGASGRRGQHITAEQRAAILARHAAGESIHRITQATGHAWETVRRVLARAADQADGEAPDARKVYPGEDHEALAAPGVRITIRRVDAANNEGTPA